jgi:hypothetical protein
MNEITHELVDGMVANYINGNKGDVKRELASMPPLAAALLVARVCDNLKAMDEYNYSCFLRSLEAWSDNDEAEIAKDNDGQLVIYTGRVPS